MHCGMWDVDDPEVVAGRDPAFSNSFRIWGYDSELGQLRPVHPRPGAPVPAQARSTSAGKSPPPTCSSPRPPTACSPSWHAAHRAAQDDVVLIWGGSGGLGSMAHPDHEGPGRHPDRRRLQRRARRVLHRASAPRATSTARSSTTGAACPTGANEETMTKADARLPRLRQGDLGRPRRAPQPPHRLRAPRPGHDPHLALRLRAPAAWSSSAPAPPATTPTSTCATSGCARSASRAPTSPTPPKPPPPTTSSSQGKIDPCLTHTYAFDETGLAHQRMHENKHPNGNMAVLVGARDAADR